MALTKVTGEFIDIGDIDISDVGTISLDAIQGDADANTSITFSGSDVITIATGGSGRLTIGDGALSPVTNNQIDLGTSSLEFKDGYFDGTVTADAFAGPLTGDVTGNVSGTAATVTTAAQSAITSVGTLTSFRSTGIDDNADALAITITSGENVYIGQTASSGVRGIDNKVQASGTDLASSSLALHRYQANAFGPYLHFAKSRHASIGSHTIVQDGDVVGALGFYPSDGGDFVGHCAEIVVQVDGTPGSDDLPGRILFKTTADGATSSTERMRITSTGAVGIGTTSPSTKLHLEDSSANSIVQLTWKNDARDWRLGVHGGVSDSLVLYDNTASATRMVVNSSGNVGIGTTSPSQLLHVSSTGSAGILLEADSDNANEDHVGEIQITQDGGATYHKLGTNNDNHAYINVSEALIIERQGTEKIRMDNAGKLFIGDSTFGGTAARFAVEVPASGAGCLIRVDSAANANETLLQFQDAAGQALGSITGNPSSNTAAYGTSSDYRLKENVSYTWDATTRLKQLKPARFNWKSQDASTVQDGFLAHEVSAIVPSAVVGAKDAKDSDDNPIYQQIDHSKLVPLLVKTIQELEARIATLEG